MSAKTYPGELWMCRPGRATFTPDYGRRGSVWVLGAFEPATGLAMNAVQPTTGQRQLHSAPGAGAVDLSRTGVGADR